MKSGKSDEIRKTVVRSGKKSAVGHKLRKGASATGKRVRRKTAKHPSKRRSERHRHRHRSDAGKHNTEKDYMQGYDSHYVLGFDTGFVKGFEDGHKLAYEQQI